MRVKVLPAMGGTSRVYGGLTAEQRSARRRAQLLEAALEQVAQRGFTATTVLDICRRAGLSQRYFYESFSDREDVVHALLDQIGDGVRDAVVEVFQARDGAPEERLRAALQALIAYFVADPRRARVSLVETFATDALRRRRGEALDAFARLGSRQLQQLDEVGSTDPRSVDLASAVIVGGLAEQLIAMVTRSGATDADDLVDQVARMWLAAVSSGAGSRA